MASIASARVLKDIKEVNTSVNIDSPSCYVVPVGETLSNARAMIVGPPDTPYEGGFFEFEFNFPSTYPNTPPKCQIITTDNATVRFNPNLYSQGKVCLSILGTWRGESADEWRSTYSILYVLQAIQALIMNSTPFHNEPGYETVQKNITLNDVIAYTEKIRHETIRVAVCNQIQLVLSNPSYSPFGNEMKNSFLMNYQNYCKICEDKKNNDGNPFFVASFEYANNNATGVFQYSILLNQLHSLKKSLDDEITNWILNGPKLTNESGRRYLRLLRELNEIESGELFFEGLSVGTVNDNPYHWNGSFMPPESSAYDGAIFTFEIVFDDEEGMRIKFLTEVFNPHVSGDGIPFYRLPNDTLKPVFSTITSIMKMISNKPNPNPIAWLDKEAASLYFSNDDQKKSEYRKRVSRCVRRSVES